MNQINVDNLTMEVKSKQMYHERLQVAGLLIHKVDRLVG